MLEVLSPLTGKSIAVFEEVDVAEGSVKALKQRLAQKIGIPRFRLRLLHDNCPLDDDQTLTLQVVQLVKVEFLPPDAEQDQGIVAACEENDDTLLEQQLNKPRSPNFQDANQITPLYAAASRGSLKCVLLLLEAGANKDQGRTENGKTPLFIAAQNGHLEVVRLLVESSANKDQGKIDTGATPLFVAAQNGHLEVVRFLVESGANKDQGTRDNGATPLFIAALKGHLEVVRFLVEAGANKNQCRTDVGATPLFIAAHQGHLEVVRCLVESGANNLLFFQSPCACAAERLKRRPKPWIKKTFGGSSQNRYTFSICATLPSISSVNLVHFRFVVHFTDLCKSKNEGPDRQRKHHNCKKGPGNP